MRIGLKSLAPTFVTVDENSMKTMTWPLQYVSPDDTTEKHTLVERYDTMKRNIQSLIERNVNQNDIGSSSYEIVIIPEQVVAVGRFTDMIVEPIVRQVQEQLLRICHQDGLQTTISSSSSLESTVPSSVNPPNKLLRFAQYNAIYSMGERRNEVHIELKEGGHPW
jgi:SOUL heme-binding protein